MCPRKVGDTHESVVLRRMCRGQPNVDTQVVIDQHDGPPLWIVPGFSDGHAARGAALVFEWFTPSSCPLRMTVPPRRSLRGHMRGRTGVLRHFLAFG